jgi:hypothetical protein
VPDLANRWSSGEKRRGLESGGAFQPLEKDVILDVIFAAFHSHQDVAARQSANGLLHDADARSTFAQSFADLTAHCPAGKVPDILLGDPSNISEYPCSV